MFESCGRPSRLVVASTPCRRARTKSRASSSSITRQLRASRARSVVDDHAADVLAVAHRLVAGLDLGQRVAGRDQLVELELTVAVEVEQARDVGPRVEPA